jgi:hypothetical protein
MTSESNKGVIHCHNQGYRVNDDGSVISSTGRKRKLTIRPSGYAYFYISLKRKTHCIGVHRLIAFQKYGHAMFENGIEVRHLDGNPSNNTPDNIAIGTKSQNAMDKPRQTRVRMALMASHKRFPPERWVPIERDIKLGATYLEIHKKYGIDRSTLSRRYRNAGLPQVRYRKKTAS